MGLPQSVGDAARGWLLHVGRPLACSAGALLILERAFIWLALNHKLARAYADATEATRETLIIVGDTLLWIGFMREVFLGTLIGGLGILLCSLAVLRTKIAPAWVAWLGFAVAVTSWFTPPPPPPLAPLPRCSSC